MKLSLKKSDIADPSKQPNNRATIVPSHQTLKQASGPHISTHKRATHVGRCSFWTPSKFEFSMCINN